MTSSPPDTPVRVNGKTLAAIDLGSNSFHMVVARVTDGHLVIVDRMKEMVQLGAGLDDARHLNDAAQARALACLERMGQRLRGLPPEAVRVVGTNTLRIARQSEEFLQKAEQALGQPIEIISGIEEARLIYQGVARDLGAEEGRRLVVDIGGGSTELVIGENSTPLDLESLYIGSVMMMRRHFDDGRVTPKRFQRAELNAMQELERVQERFKRLGWSKAIGASGTVRSVARVVEAYGLSPRGITKESLEKLRELLIQAGSVDRVSLTGLSQARAALFPGGVAVLSALFQSLDIDSMTVSDSALREGLLTELLGRIQHRDVRSATVDALMERYHVDVEQARRVEETVKRLVPQVTTAWSLPEERALELCSWAARLHEIGLDIAHSHYHKHGAYVLENADMPGFSQKEQRLLASLVRAHRRKFPAGAWKTSPSTARLVEHLAVVLRLAVLLHRSRTDVSDVTIVGNRRSLEVRFQPGWLETHPLTQADLQEEAEILKMAGFELKGAFLAS